MASTSKRCSKKQRGLWLIGGTLDCITGQKLPSNGQVLARFLHLHTRDHHTIPASASSTAVEVLQFWDRARIPVRLKCNIVSAIRDLHAQWVGLKKNASRQTDTQRSKEDAFRATLPDMFDIAHADALTLIKIAEDREFLIAQREKGRRGSMGPVDTKLAKKEKSRQEKLLQAENIKKLKQEQSRGNPNKEQSSESSTSSEESSDNDSGNAAYKPPKNVKRKRPSNIIGPELASALDRTKISDRNATYVLAAAAESLGHSLEDITLNKESIRTARRRHRETVANEIRVSFAPQVPLTVHWDGKMLPSLMSKESVERLAVIVSGEGVMKLLGVPKIPDGTGESQAKAVFDSLENWNLTNRVQFNRELLQLALLFLGESLPIAEVHIHTPGAFHRARWMAKIIYSLKIFLFRSQFHLSVRELSGLRDFSVFVLKIYLESWYTAACAATAPQNDLNLLRKLQKYKTTNETIATAAIQSFSRHLWYLSETLIGLAFFDSTVPVVMKRAMVSSLDKDGELDVPLRRFVIEPRNIERETDQLCSKELSDFVSSNTRKLFVAAGITDDFLKTDPNTWDRNDNYIKAQKIIHNLKVVNDAAERGVALIQSFNAVLTNQEEQKQFLLQIVEKHRQDFPNSKKSTVVGKK